MRAAIMQPYLFPYLGYFQLMAASRVFVAADDVQYIEGGWVNRNRILLDGRAEWLTMPVRHADHRLPINAREYLLDDRLARRLRTRIVGAYRGAPFFEHGMALVDEVLECDDPNVGRYNTRALSCMARHLGIESGFHVASLLPPLDAPGEARVIARCQQVGADEYLNPIGGQHLYDEQRFATAGLRLRFLEPNMPTYRQFGDAFISSLSIIDVLMFNDMSAVKAMLAA